MSVERGNGPRPEPQIRPEDAIDSFERRRLSRQVYDSLAQLVWVIDAKLTELMNSGDPKTAASIRECEGLIREIKDELSGLKSDHAPR